LTDAAQHVEICDVLVLGSGSAGLAAALTAAAGGLSTVIVEKAHCIGGTTAMSGAITWVPANHHARSADLRDSRDEALAYLRAAAPPGWCDTEDALWRSFVSAAPRMLAFLESKSPLRFRLCDGADPLSHLPGAKPHGRTLAPRPLRRSLVGRYAKCLRRPMLPHLFTPEEARRLDISRRPRLSAARLAPRLLLRWLTGTRTAGTALVIGLLKGCLDHGCRIELETAGIQLITDETTGAVRGAVVERAGQRRSIRTRRGVVLASGGFEWDAERRAMHFPGPIDFITSPRTNTGDAHSMAEAAGAALAHMDQANLSPGAPIFYDGAPQGISLYFQRAPNAILVDRNGRRFVNEHTFNLGEAIDARDASGAPRYLPAWLISDRRFLARAPLLRRSARLRPDWIVRAASLEELADRIGLPRQALATTISRFNGFCAAGRDDDFHREEETSRSTAGDCLRPIERPPFLAIPFNRSFVSTKGGPRTNAGGEVLRPNGSLIQGLFCAGVAMANPIGTRAVGSGTTIGPNLTWGFICGESLLDCAPPAPSPTDRTRQPETTP
jgi:3-oxosteroid 1-dehydrogenase